MAYPNHGVWFDKYLESLDNDELLALGSALEKQLVEIRNECQSSEPNVKEEGRDLKSAAIDLGVGSGLGGIGISWPPSISDCP